MKSDGVVFIAVYGHGGSGKTTFSNKLAAALGAEVIHIDDFTGEGSTSDWYLDLLDKVIEPALAGAESISYPRAKWWPGHNPDPIVDQPVTQIMIIEGTCAARSELRSYLNLKVFIDIPRDICIKRGLARDKGMSGRSDAEIAAIWQQWQQWDDEYFAADKPQLVSDITVTPDTNFEDLVVKVKERLAENISQK